MSVEEKLFRYRDLLERWNKRINLVSPSTIQDFEERHLRDSSQLFHVKHSWTGDFVDLGTGGGLPGIVLSVHLEENGHRGQKTLVESDTRKATFLRTATRELGLDIRVISRRIEDVPPLNAQTLTARALAPLPKLLDFATIHLAPEGTCLFPKGENWQEEVKQAQEIWQFDMSVTNSQTNAGSAILEIGRIRRV